MSKITKKQNKKKVNINQLNVNYGASSNNANNITRGQIARDAEKEEEEDADYRPPKTCNLESSSASDGDSESDDDSDKDFQIDHLLEGEAAADAWNQLGLGVAPHEHILSRKRIGRPTNTGSGKKKKTNSNRTDPKTVTVAKRLLEFPNQCFMNKYNQLWCTACNTAIAMKKATIENHTQSSMHSVRATKLNGKAIDTGTIHQFVSNINSTRVDAGDSFTTRPQITEERMKVVIGLLQDNISFEFLNNKSHSGVRALLEESRYILPYRELKDMIPSVGELIEQISVKEMKNKKVTVIFDGTPNVAEVFAVVFRFIGNDGKITHRVGAIKFYNKSFNANNLAQVLLDVLSRKPWFLDRYDLRFTVSDGCPTNNAGLSLLPPMFTEFGKLICISHSSNVVGKTLLLCLPLAKRFEEKWSAMITVSYTARQLFKEFAEESAVSTSEVRWYTWFEDINQIFQKAAAVSYVVNHESEFSQSNRDAMREMLIDADALNNLRIELALGVDCGVKLVKLCYAQEGDAMFLCVNTYDHWYSVLEHLKEITADVTSIDRLRVLLPTSNTIVQGVYDNSIGRQNVELRNGAKKLLPVYEKMSSDTSNRLSSTLDILRVCRLFGFKFIASVDLEALEAEIYKVSFICIGHRYIDNLQAELSDYKKIADATVQNLPDEDDVTFWKRHQLVLKYWYIVSREIAIITPSSATVERLFSLLSQGFDKSQDSCLSDYKAASVSLRYNRNFGQTLD